MPRYFGDFAVNNVGQNSAFRMATLTHSPDNLFHCRDSPQQKVLALKVSTTFAVKKAERPWSVQRNMGLYHQAGDAR